MEKNELSNPVDIAFLSAITVMSQPKVSRTSSSRFERAIGSSFFYCILHKVHIYSSVNDLASKSPVPGRILLDANSVLPPRK